ncbi:response regulator transcription factor [Galbibacter sp. CMA-7]|uniref:Response regulator transcription factor n=1 Tax=Galbibacter pacificus TaxID=2996052 RepID=A0ABT6FTJ7_9FLAO|nr:response regulator transcription factor [Galbibacter pacificus]MDG3583109.1 response regulator transcription factor [Galbibacter pacificus]MDG3586590.1 response regulator transcription factor [Galbibacter pacificus]
MNPSIIIADDHPLLLKGLHDFLVEGKFNVLASAQDGNSAYNLIIKYQPDIAILDIEMPKMSGLEIALACRNNKIGAKIILITLHKEPQLIIQAKDLNVNGYILKEYAIEEIKICLEKVMQDEQYFSPAIMDQINKGKFENEEILQAITPSERKILRLIAKEKTNKEIAEILFISIRTVEKHRSNIITKLGVSHKTNALLLWAKDHQDILLK